MTRRVGVLALQGAISEHMDMLGRLGAEGVFVKKRADLSALDALIIPGGESTAISKLVRKNDMEDAVREFAGQRPILGTCAGLILCGGSVAGPEQEARPLGLMDTVVERNGFGRQVNSFEAELSVAGIGVVPAVFIRAPYICSAGTQVRVMASIDDKIVMAEQGKVLVTAFHPELADDLRIFTYFLGKIPD